MEKERLRDVMKEMESGFNHEAADIDDACGVSKEKVMRIGLEALDNIENNKTTSALIELVLNSDGTEKEKLLTCFRLGGFLEKQGMKEGI